MAKIKLENLKSFCKENLVREGMKARWKPTAIAAMYRWRS